MNKLNIIKLQQDIMEVIEKQNKIKIDSFSLSEHSIRISFASETKEEE